MTRINREMVQIFSRFCAPAPGYSGFALQIGPCRFFLSAWAFCLLAERSSARLQADASPHKRISSLALLLFRPSNTNTSSEHSFSPFAQIYCNEEVPFASETLFHGEVHSCWAAGRFVHPGRFSLRHTTLLNFPLTNQSIILP